MFCPLQLFPEINRLFRKNMKLPVQVTKTWGRFMPGYQNLITHEKWLPKLSSKFSNPYHPGIQD